MSEEKNNQTEEQSAESQQKAGDMKDELEELRKQSEEYLNGWKRAKADYANLQKEKEKERKEIIEFANAALIGYLLPVYNNLKKAVEHADGTITADGDANLKNWIEGIRLIKKQWEDIFNMIGLEEIKTVGEKFNPELHEAVKRSEELGVESGEEKDGEKEDIIIEEMEPGYTFKGKVINPAKVIVG